MNCWCGMDGVGACLRCQRRLCADHALRGGIIPSGRDGLLWSRSAYKYTDILVSAGIPTDFGTGESAEGLVSKLQQMPPNLRPLFQYPGQRQAFNAALYDSSGVICEECRIDKACEAADAIPQPTAPALKAGESQRLRDATVAYLLGDIVALASMASDEALKDALFRDLIHLAREKAERFQVPVEWKVMPGNERYTGEVLATEEAFHVVDVTGVTGYDPNWGVVYGPSPRHMNRHGQWGPPAPKPVETGLFFKKRAFRGSWSDEPPQPELHHVLKRAAELLAPAA